MITGDLDRALATPISSAGTWRPAPPGSGGAPGTYATTIAFLLARQGSTGAPAIAAALAGRLRGLEWVRAVAVTGGGYLTVTVTADMLARLAVRITQAGPGCARSDALAAAVLTAPATVDLASTRTWEEARQRLAVTVLPRLAEAAGAQVTWTHDTERMAVPGSPAHAAGGQEPGSGEAARGEAARGDAGVRRTPAAEQHRGPHPQPRPPAGPGGGAIPGLFKRAGPWPAW